MTILGLLLWIAGIGMIVGGIVVVQDTPIIGAVVILGGLLVSLYAARRDYDPSRTPQSQMRR